MISSIEMFSEQNLDNNYQLNYKINVERAPIAISNDDEFHTQAGDEGWNIDGRDGSKDYPYLIYNNSITAGGSTKLIDIRNTRVYFIVDHCDLIGGGTGIYLENISNAVISNSFINKSTIGIDIRQSDNIKVLSNDINNTINGIYHLDSQ